MKKSTTLIFILFYLFTAFGQQRFDVQFMVEGHLRQSIIVRPSTAPPPGGYPVVFMLHGTSQDGEEFYENSGWKELGESENFITVFPTSLSWCYVDDGVEKNSRRWVNAGVTDFPCSGPAQDYVDDVFFLKLLAKRIADTFPVNPAMIFASGFSNGSNMIHKLAMDAGDVFAACAGSGGFLIMGDSTKPVKRIPVWAMVGTNDDRYFIPPFTEIPFGGDSVLIYLGRQITRMLSCQALTEAFIKTETPITHTYEFSESQPGEDSELYRFTLVKGMYHVYPNGNNFRIEAPKLFWEFFKKSVVKVENETIRGQGLKAWPNPSGDRMYIQAPQSLHQNTRYELYDILGRNILTGDLDSADGWYIDKSQCGRGTFILRVYNDRSVWQTSLVFE